VPTIAEAGVIGYEIGSWQGVFAPAGTPPSVVARLNAEIVKIINLPDVKEKLLVLGAEPVGNSSEEFTIFVKAEVVKWGDVVKKSGARVD
jgi:tripartite-type tricarboxylate transporter receptor subunit TctC